MTGIERLRKLTDATLGHVRVASVTHYYEYENDVEWDERMHLSELLASIYSQINREQDAMVADSPYEALPPEEREAIAWVRDHGGLDTVKAEWSSRVPHDLYERRRQRLLGHIAECEAALGRRNVRIEELGKTIEFFQLNNSNFRHLLADVAERLGFTRYGDDYEPEDLLDALDRRLMPEVRAGGGDAAPEIGGAVSQSKWVRVGSVRRFDHVTPGKAQALKPLDEAEEVFGAWQEMERERAECLSYGNEGSGDGDVVAMRECLLDECADVIQATLNLVAALGVEDFRPWMKACEERNRERGRITK